MAHKSPANVRLGHFKPTFWACAVAHGSPPHRHAGAPGALLPTGAHGRCQRRSTGDSGFPAPFLHHDPTTPSGRKSRPRRYGRRMGRDRTIGHVHTEEKTAAPTHGAMACACGGVATGSGKIPPIHLSRVLGLILTQSVCDAPSPIPAAHEIKPCHGRVDYAGQNPRRFFPFAIRGIDCPAGCAHALSREPGRAPSPASRVRLFCFFFYHDNRRRPLGRGHFYCHHKGKQIFPNAVLLPHVHVHAPLYRARDSSARVSCNTCRKQYHTPTRQREPARACCYGCEFCAAD